MLRDPNLWLRSGAGRRLGSSWCSAFTYTVDRHGLWRMEDQFPSVGCLNGQAPIGLGEVVLGHGSRPGDSSPLGSGHRLLDHIVAADAGLNAVRAAGGRICCWRKNFRGRRRSGNSRFRGNIVGIVLLTRWSRWFGWAAARTVISFPFIDQGEVSRTLADTFCRTNLFSIHMLR